MILVRRLCGHAARHDHPAGDHFAPYLALVLLFFNRVIPAILMLLATAFMSPVVIARPAALALAGQDWDVVVHRPPGVLVVMGGLALVFAVLLLFELMGLGLAVMARTVATIARIALIPFMRRFHV